MNESNKISTQRLIKFLGWFCPSHLLEEIEGDLYQRYERDLLKFNKRKAKWRLLFNALKFFRPGIIFRNQITMKIYRAFLIKNYIRVMVRNMTKNKMSTAINVFGLTVGFTFSLLMGLFIFGELQVNKGIKDVSNLYLLESQYKDVVENFEAFTPCPLSVEAVRLYPEIFKAYYRFWDREVTASSQDRHFRVQTMIGDSSFFDMFEFPVIYGDVRKALHEPNTIAISEKVALQFFDRIEVVGELIYITTERKGKQAFVVQAVLKDFQPKNSVTDFMNSNAQMMLPLTNASDFSLSDNLDDWRADIITYVKTKEGITTKQVSEALNDLLRRNTSWDVNQNRSITAKSIYDFYLTTNGGAVKTLIIILSTIVLFIILLAVVNFVNLSLSGSLARLKEIGVRKVIGGLKQQVVFQFIMESIALALTSLIISTIAYELLRSVFSQSLGSPLPSIFNLSFVLYSSILGGAVTIGILAGIYPSIYLSRSGVVESLKGKLRSIKANIQFSRSLIGFQFLVTIFVFIAALILRNQISYFFEKDLGFDKSFVMNVTSVPRLLTPEGFDKVERVKSEFLSAPGVEAATLSWGTPSGSISPKDFKIYKEGQNVEEGLQTSFGSVDEDYAQVFGLKILEGQFLYEQGSSFKPYNIVLNETAQKILKVNVGDRVRIQFFNNAEFTVAGIVKDFHFKSMHEPIKPLAFMHNRDFRFYRHYSFKLSGDNLADNVEAVERTWRKVFPDDPIVFGFVDEKLELMYRTELKMKRAAEIGSVLMLLIVLTGVLGLVTLSLQKRTKEIGIRMVLGANTGTIISLIAREYVYLILFSIVVSIPLAYWFADQWLQKFAFRADLNSWMFIAPVILLLTITVLSVVIQTLRKALANPIDSLRYE